jgi:hypothetical protein
MSSRFVKITCAAALALPLAAVAMPSAHAVSFPGENDCNHHFSGAVVQTPHTGDSCYGIDQRAGRAGASGHTYTVDSVAVGTHFVAYCDNGDVMNKDGLDTALDVTTDHSAPNEAVSSSDPRLVGNISDTAFALLCLDDHGRSHY